MREQLTDFDDGGGSGGALLSRRSGICGGRPAVAAVEDAIKKLGNDPWSPMHFDELRANDDAGVQANCRVRPAPEVAVGCRHETVLTEDLVDGVGQAAMFVSRPSS